jgi:hypothetical protein
MLTDQFTSKYKGRFIDYDHAFGFQCVDVMRQYILDVFSWSPYVAVPTTGNAKNIFYNFKDNKYFKKVLNSPYNAPKKGDIVFFGTYLFLYGLSGHVAVCESADSMNLLTFDQNYPTGTPCHFQKHSYKGCLGWLTPR